MQGVILYGPPAVGKDTITQALTDLDPRYVLFPRIKVGAGRTNGYRMVTSETLNRLRLNGEVIWENDRYNATYVIDRSGLVRHLGIEFPVLHLGQAEGVEAVMSALPDVSWIVVDLHCLRSIGLERIKVRGTGDVEQRVAAWDQTPRLSNPHLSIDTGTTSPVEAARSVQKLRSRL